MCDSPVNTALAAGRVLLAPHPDHIVHEEAFYALTLGVRRRSGREDALPVILPGRALVACRPAAGESVRLEGQLRTYNRAQADGGRLQIRLFARSLAPCPPGEEENLICLTGFLCRPPVYRTTPLGRQIADLLLAVNRAYHKSDYVPLIAWGGDARRAAALAVGDKIAVEGRLQSRLYHKQLPGGALQERTAYEVSLTGFSRAE